MPATAEVAFVDIEFEIVVERHRLLGRTLGQKLTAVALFGRTILRGLKWNMAGVLMATRHFEISTFSGIVYR